METTFQLLTDYHGQSVEGFLMSPKLDGWRLGWTGADFILRGGGVLRVPGWWKMGMPTTALDGELFAGAGNFNFIQGRIRDVGGEGAVVRNPAARYVPARTGDVLRWVPVDPRVKRRKVA